MLTPYLLIGEVLRPQGVRGEAKLRWDASDPERCLEWNTLYLREGEGYTPVPVRLSRVQGGFAFGFLADCASPEDVERWRGKALYIDRAHAAPLAEGEYYITDLIGCEVFSTDGQKIGVMKDVLQYGAKDIYVMKTAKGEMMAPALAEVFVETDVAANRITAAPERLAEVAVYNP